MNRFHTHKHTRTHTKSLLCTNQLAMFDNLNCFGCKIKRPMFIDNSVYFVIAYCSKTKIAFLKFMLVQLVHQISPENKTILFNSKSVRKDHFEGTTKN